VTCQTVGGIQLNSFNLKVKWGKKVGKQWLIGWANRRDNGEEYRRKEEESARTQSKTNSCDKTKYNRHKVLVALTYI